MLLFFGLHDSWFRALASSSAVSGQVEPLYPLNLYREFPFIDYCFQIQLFYAGFFCCTPASAFREMVFLLLAVSFTGYICLAPLVFLFRGQIAAVKPFSPGFSALPVWLVSRSLVWLELLLWWEAQTDGLVRGLTLFTVNPRVRPNPNLLNLGLQIINPKGLVPDLYGSLYAGSLPGLPLCQVYPTTTTLYSGKRFPCREGSLCNRFSPFNITKGNIYK